MALRDVPDQPDFSDPAAFGAMYDEQLPAIYGYLLRRTGGSHAIAEDLTQDVFLAAARQLAKSPAIADVRRWLFGIARHRLIDHYRAAIGPIEPLVEAIDPGDELAAIVDRAAAIAALDALLPDQRAAMVMRYLEAMSPPEIAMAMGKSVHAIESLLARGRVAFKRVYLEQRDE